jgi:tetratricopeptide (TPR) repeat protein
MIAQAGRRSTPFERFLLEGSYEQAALEQELALHYLVDGDFATAAKTFQTTKATSNGLGTDPFAIHIVDCHDCDHARYGSSPWTHDSFAARLAELERAAKGSGEAAAAASLEIGNALYNITYYGNARVVLADSHHATNDTRDAEKWYKRAYDLSKNRELKAKAAYLASKAELGRLLNASGPTWQPLNRLPIPKTWFPIVKQLSDTRYYREVLRECGNFAGWVQGRP